MPRTITALAAPASMSAAAAARRRSCLPARQLRPHCAGTGCARTSSGAGVRLAPVHMIEQLTDDVRMVATPARAAHLYVLGSRTLPSVLLRWASCPIGGTKPCSGSRHTAVCSSRRSGMPSMTISRRSEVQPRVPELNAPVPCGWSQARRNPAPCRVAIVRCPSEAHDCPPPLAMEPAWSRNNAGRWRRDAVS